MKDLSSSRVIFSLSKKHSGFTLVELIIVITILSILGLVAFIMMNDATVSARDSNRLASIKNIYDASQLQAVQQRILPLPDQAITLTVSGSNIGWQGYMSGYIAQAYGYSDSVYDPQDHTPYIYRVGQARDKSQYLAYLENGGDVSRGDILVAQSFFSSFLNTAQASDFSKRVPYVYGDKLGIVLSSTTNEPANALIYDQNTNTGTLDLGSGSIDTSYSVYVNESLKLSSVEGTGATALKTNDGLDSLLAGATIVASSGSSSGSGSGSGGGSNDPTCGLTSQEVIDLNAVKGESYTAEDWCAMTNLQWNNLELTDIPNAVAKLRNTETLNLGNNLLTLVPVEIQYLGNLKYLYIDQNQITHIPEFIGNITTLQELSFWRNQLQNIPDSLQNLTSLVYLDFDENTSLGDLGTWWSTIYNYYGVSIQSNITALGQPVSISASSLYPYIQIQNTTAWNGSECGLTYEEVANLNTYLNQGERNTAHDWCIKTSINWGYKSISNLPDAIGKLHNLTYLELSNNQISIIPESIGNLTSLAYLSLYNNPLTTLPDSFANLVNLKVLDLSGNGNPNGLAGLNDYWAVDNSNDYGYDPEYSSNIASNITPLGQSVSINSSLSHSTIQISVFTPPVIHFSPIVTEKRIAAGVDHTCGINSTGGIICWGDNWYGAKNFPPGITNATHIDVGGWNGCVRTSDGNVSCWGSNGYDNEYNNGDEIETIPNGYFSNESSIDINWQHVCALNSNGSIKCYGQYVPPEITSRTDFVQVTTGAEHSCALDNRGGVVCWGSENEAPGFAFDFISAGWYDTCGIRHDDQSVMCWGHKAKGNQWVAPWTIPNTTGITKVTVGDSHACAITGGNVICWGDNWYGQTSVPVGLSNVVDIDAGEYHTCALKNDNSVACWGMNGESRSIPPPTGLE